MNERAVARLYDALCVFEARWRPRQDAYPVHKRLRFADAPGADIYDWIIERVDLRGARSVLDAGCGVGFGALRLAERSAARITGISLSEEELARARHAAAQRRLDDRVVFLRRSFDELPRAAFDVVIAVESLKHSVDLVRSLQSVVAALVPSGRLVIVEDLPNREPRPASARQLAEDWELTRLHGQNDYLESLGPRDCTVVDLSSSVPHASTFSICAKLAGLQLAAPFTRATQIRALRAFRGGLHLERLYADGAMSYKAIVYSKRPTTPS